MIKVGLKPRLLNNYRTPKRINFWQIDMLWARAQNVKTQKLTAINVSLVEVHLTPTI
mgnify:CR=1 FL=1